MKLTSSRRGNEQGSLVIMCLIFCAVLGITIASYLVLVRSQFLSTARSHNWNAAVILAEAGVEDAMALVNKNTGDFYNITNWPATAVGADHWTITNGVYYAHRSPDASLGGYDVWITNHVTSVSICAVGTAHWDINPDSPQLADNVRTLLVQAALQPLFQSALGAGNNINFNGNTVTVDSYDSADPQYSIWSTNGGTAVGLYSSTRRKADGDLAAMGNIVGAASPASTKIYGTVYTSPGGYTNLVVNASVGDTNWLKLTTPGIQPGRVRDDLNVVMPNVINPPTTPAMDPLTNNIFISDNSHPYTIQDNDGLDENLTITAPNVVIYMVNGIGYNGHGNNSTLTVATNGSVTIYAGGAINLGTGASIRNLTSDSANLRIYGLTNLTSVTLGGVNSFLGTIYAPQADIAIGSPSGGGPGGPGGPGGTSYRFTGAVVGKSIQFNERVSFHYDENLRRLNNGAPPRGYVATNWTEL